MQLDRLDIHGWVKQLIIKFLGTIICKVKGLTYHKGSIQWMANRLALYPQALLIRFKANLQGLSKHPMIILMNSTQGKYIMKRLGICSNSGITKLISTLITFLSITYYCGGSVTIYFNKERSHEIRIQSQFDTLFNYKDSIFGAVIENITREDFDEKVIPNMYKIKELQFIDSTQMTLSNNIFQLQRLVDLQIDMPFLSVISDSISMLKNLNRLVVYRSDVDIFPCGIYKLSCLKVLYFDNSNISYLSSEISNLHNLVFLSLSGNQIKHIDANSISQLKKLFELRLDGNGLEDLPDDLCKMSSLKYAWFQNNNIQNVPQCVFRIKSLTRLQLYENPLSPAANELYLEYLTRISNNEK
jgi:Leucine-rich repeat (LRR) protein